MGTDLTIFIEFYGLPGCGKSTISHLVAKKLRRQNKKVVEPTYYLDHSCPKYLRKLLKIIKLIKYCAKKSHKYKLLKKLIRQNGYSGIDILSQAANIIPKLQAYDNEKAEYVIFDEGLIQSALSLGYYEHDCTANEKMLYSLCKDRTVIKIYLAVSMETALERMNCRNRHDSRIEKISVNSEKTKFLQLFERHCNSVMAGCLINEKDIEESVKAVIKEIQRTRKHLSE